MEKDKVQIKNLSKSFGEVTVLKDINLDIEKGEFISLLGPSGCGKTTMLRIIAGLLDADTGEIIVEGNDYQKIPVYKRSNGMVFQNYALFPHMTVYKNVEYGLKMHKVPKAERQEKIMKALKMVHMDQYEKRYPKELSGGQQQRVALARALVLNPTLLLLDEPLSNLDAKLRKEMQLEIRNIQKNLNVTTLFVTHDQEEALTMSDRIAVMNKGVIEQIGTPVELYENPKTEFVAYFIGNTNLLKGQVEDCDGTILQVRVGDDMFKIEKEKPCEPGDEITFSIRPEKITLHRIQHEDLVNGIPGVIKSRVYMGTGVNFVVGLSDGTDIRISLSALDKVIDLQQDEHVYVEWKPEDARIVE